MSIHLSTKHGVNPSMSVCFFCGEVKELVLMGRLKGDQEAPKKAVFNHEPCDKCKALMNQGIMLIEVDEEKSSDRQNPYRTGNVCVIKEEPAKRIFKTLGKSRVAFVDIQAWTQLKLPREAENNDTQKQN